jgi:16S rRNA (uracil1498-N3)-methyltransferase
MTKIFVNQSLTAGQVIRIQDSNHHHLQVIRISPGDILLVGDSDFKEFEAEVTSCGKKFYELEIKKESQLLLKPSVETDLYISIPKKYKLEDIIFRCSQIGVSRFIPIISSRTIKRMTAENFERIRDRLHKKAVHGSEISGRADIPEIKDIVSFEKAVENLNITDDSAGDSAAILFWEEEKKGIYISDRDIKEKMFIFIGPEGGFTPEEIGLAKEKGIMIRTLGKLVFDVETACIAGTASILCRERK